MMRLQLATLLDTLSTLSFVRPFRVAGGRKGAASISSSTMVSDLAHEGVRLGCIKPDI